MTRQHNLDKALIQHFVSPSPLSCSQPAGLVSQTGADGEAPEPVERDTHLKS